MNDQNKNSECCPKFDPAAWDEKTFEWQDRAFVKDKVFTIFYIPINFGGTMKRIVKKLENAGACMPDGLCLSEHTSKWNMDLYCAVDKEIPDSEIVKMSGKFLVKVYEGDFKNTGKWCEDFEQYAKGKGVSLNKSYMWYTTCPKCAKKYGKNYVAIVGQV